LSVEAEAITLLAFNATGNLGASGTPEEVCSLISVARRPHRFLSFGCFRTRQLRSRKRSNIHTVFAIHWNAHQLEKIFESRLITWLG
jgi:hypothetical protein